MISRRKKKVKIRYENTTSKAVWSQRTFRQVAHTDAAAAAVMAAAAAAAVTTANGAGGTTVAAVQHYIFGGEGANRFSNNILLLCVYINVRGDPAIDRAPSVDG